MISLCALLLLAASLSAPLAIPPMPEPVPLRADDRPRQTS